MVALLELPLGYYLITGKVPPRGRSSTAAPFGAFPTKDGWVNLGVGGTPVWVRFCHAIDRPDWLEVDRYKDAVGRVAYRSEIEPYIAEWSKARTTEEVMDIMRSNQVACGPIWDMEQVVNSPQVAARNMLVTVDDPVVGPRRIVGNPIKMSDLSEGPPAAAALRVGQDTAAVLSELLGLTAEEIRTLEAAGAIASSPPAASSVTLSVE
jgi:crotonobetainyl-CoA:carnitine CoA-transferase CaiB-like acyl-CoA transferase